MPLYIVLDTNWTSKDKPDGAGVTWEKQAKTFTTREATEEFLNGVARGISCNYKVYRVDVKARIVNKEITETKMHNIWELSEEVLG